MHKYRSVNPKNGQLLKEFDQHTDKEMFQAVDKAYKRYQDLLYAPEMANAFLKERIMKFENLMNLLKERRLDLAKLMTDEMGKPIA
jgi:succinate-semialdehyde dehydrogenase/glutarate-semialdehyde dehydrogenase